MMKKLLAILVALALTFGAAAAETVDYTQMTTEELQAILAAVTAELDSRSVTRSAPQERTLTVGKYIVGQDIEAGVWLLTCTGTEGEQYSNVYSSLGNAYDSMTDGSGFGSLFGALGGMMNELSYLSVDIIGNYGETIQHFELKADQSVRITLREGTALRIQDGTCKVVKE